MALPSTEWKPRKMAQKISASVVGFALGWIFFGPQGTFARRWLVVDGWTLKEVCDFHTRAGAQDYASELNEDIQFQGWRSRYITVHKSFTEGWM